MTQCCFSKIQCPICPCDRTVIRLFIYSCIHNICSSPLVMLVCLKQHKQCYLLLLPLGWLYISAFILCLSWTNCIESLYVNDCFPMLFPLTCWNWWLCLFIDLVIVYCFTYHQWLPHYIPLSTQFTLVFATLTTFTPLRDQWFYFN